MKNVTIGCIVLSVLAACSNPYDEPLLVDGAKSSAYTSDLAACRRLVENHTQDDLKSSAIGGAVLGGLIGGIDSKDGNRADDALTGAVIGGGIGALDGKFERDEERRTILIRCMQGRGHRVLA
jgi:uncharacterized protein YcfJ